MEEEVNVLFEIIEKRDEEHPTVFSSQYDPRDWYVRLGKSTQCESILNRILSNKVLVDCDDFNMREYCAKKAKLY